MTLRAQKKLFVSVAALAGLGVAALALLPPAHLAEPGADAPASGSTMASAASAANLAVPTVSSLDRANLRERFVGSAVCAPCHDAQAKAHARSHHGSAIVPPSSPVVAPKLDGASFSTPLGGMTRFAAKDGGFSVTSPGADGRSRTFPLAYAAGVFPLQQYVVETERGKLQTLGPSWDSRAAKDGGERWFHVYGPRGIAHDDELFFTGAAQNWNHVCADCHSTFVERRYDVEKDAFDTRWAELSVGCEACHGPGAEHVRLAKSGAKGAAWGRASGFPVALEPAAPWTPSSGGSPVPRQPDTLEIEVCAPCHSRREPLHEGFVAGDALLDAFEPELLLPGRYHADGQVEGEVYEWGSFLQSKMFASGVRCSDCHEPHSAELRAPGNALCQRCHSTARFGTEAHSHHTGEKAPGCVDCHMPRDVFMQVDERRDHSIRIPRPDHSVAFGTPNACNDCHTKKDAPWAADALAKWFPGSSKRSHFVDAFAALRKGALDAPVALRTLASNPTMPAIARATALEALGELPTPKALETLRTALAGSEQLVVYGAVLGASRLAPTERARLLLPLAAHRLRAVRIAVGKALAGVPLTELDAGSRAALERAFADVEASFVVSASLPQSHVERSSFALARGRPEEAERALATALKLAPCLAAAHLNLADLARARQDEAAAEKEIRAALRCAPNNGFVHHALGLWQVRAKRPVEAVVSLRKAVELAPNEVRFRYVLAVAIAETGDFAAALAIVDAALAGHPNDAELLQASAMYRTRLGRIDEAATAKRRLDELRSQ